MDANRKIISNQKGFALVYIALAVAAMVGMLGLTIDLGHLYVVRGELQNAADASALAGAAALYKDPLNPTAVTTLNFVRARNTATGFIGQNKSDKVSLTSGTSASGYWNLANNSLGSPVTPSVQHVPAVTATISRAAGSNGGPVATYFARVFGVDQSAVSSRQAVAMSGFVGSVPGGALFPMALSSCMTDHYFSQNPMPATPPTIIINSVYNPGGNGCYTGQWTSFKLDTNNVPSVTALMNTGNPDPLQVGDDIWIQPGAKAALYKEVNNWLPAAGGKDVLMAIVGTSSGDINTHAEMVIKGFASYHIDSANQGGKFITGHFIAYYSTYPGTTPGGSVSNAVTKPKMVQ